MEKENRKRKHVVLKIERLTVMEMMIGWYIAGILCIFILKERNSRQDKVFSVEKLLFISIFMITITFYSQRERRR